MREKLKGASQSVSWEHHPTLLRVALEHGTLSFAHIIIRWTSTLSQFFELLSLLWVTQRKSQYPLHSFGPCHVLLLCLSVQGKYPPRESAIPNILPQNPCQSMFFWSTNYISVSVSCRWWGIHQGPPVTSVSLSTSTHYSGIRPRNQLVPWDLHALMESLLMFGSGLTSLTFDWMIPRMFDFSSSIHVHWNVLSTLGIIDINGDLPRAC